MRFLKCKSLFHDSRRGHPDWQEVVGYRKDLNDGPPLTEGHGMLCKCCAMQDSPPVTIESIPDVFARLGITPEQLQEMISVNRVKG